MILPKNGWATLPKFKSDFSIIVFENPKNLGTIWNELEKHWKVSQHHHLASYPIGSKGFRSKYKFFNKHDIRNGGNLGKGELKINLE